MNYEVSDDQKTVTITYASCNNNQEVLNGSMSMYTKNLTSYQLTFDNFSYDGSYGTGFFDLKIDTTVINNIYNNTIDGQIQ